MAGFCARYANEPPENCCAQLTEQTGTREYKSSEQHDQVSEAMGQLHGKPPIQVNCIWEIITIYLGDYSHNREFVKRDRKPPVLGSRSATAPEHRE